LSEGMRQIRPELVGHPDRLRWNARYSGEFVPSFAAHPLAATALAMRLPEGPVLDLACGPSGSALLAAEAGRRVTAVDASDVALGLLLGEASRRQLDEMITVVHADLHNWRPSQRAYALVLCTGYWDRALFAVATSVVAADGLIGWEAFTQAALRDHPQLPAEWCLSPGEPTSLLPAGFEVLSEQDAVTGSGKRQLLARRQAGSARARS